MTKKFNIANLGERLEGKIIIILHATTGEENTDLYSFYNMFYGEDTVSGAYIDQQVKMCVLSGHKCMTSPIEATKLSKHLLETINTNQMVRVTVTSNGTWNYKQ